MIETQSTVDPIDADLIVDSAYCASHREHDIAMINAQLKAYANWFDYHILFADRVRV